jgi:hypothetical protein
VNDRALHLASQPAEEAALAGDQGLEFEVFFDRERARLFRALCLVTRNRFEAEELVQDAFLSVYEQWDRVSEMEGRGPRRDGPRTPKAHTSSASGARADGLPGPPSPAPTRGVYVFLEPYLPHGEVICSPCG